MCSHILKPAYLFLDEHSICCTNILYCLAVTIFPQVIVTVAVSVAAAPTFTYTNNMKKNLKLEIFNLFAMKRLEN